MENKYRNFTELLDEYLKDPECAASFLSSALEEEDLDVFLLSLKDVIRVQGNIKSVAEKAKINRGTLYKIFSSEKANPEIRTVQAILNSLGYELKVSRKTSRKKKSNLNQNKTSKPVVKRRSNPKRVSSK